MTHRIIALQPIAPYVGPQWLVIPQGTLDNLPEAIAALEDEGYSVLDTNVLGWDGHNTIIRTTYGDDYLATRTAQQEG